MKESLLRVLPLRLQAQRGHVEAEQFVEKHERKGFLLMGTFYEALEAYEAQRELTFEEYLPTLLEGIDIERELEAWQAAQSE